MIPEFNNLYASLSTSHSKDWIASCFKNAGWAIRHCTWADYEVECDFAELVIEGDTEILLSGAVASFDAAVPFVATILEENRVGYSIEYYDETGNLLRRITNMPDGTDAEPRDGPKSR